MCFSIKLTYKRQIIYDSYNLMTTLQMRVICFNSLRNMILNVMLKVKKTDKIKTT